MTPSANRRVLIIDDTPSIHDDFRRVLSGGRETSEVDAAEQELLGQPNPPVDEASFEIDSAYQGREGLDKVAASLAVDRPYALAFVDMRMPPGWDGVETIREIWKADPRLQIVICTAHSDYSWDEVLGKLGVEDRLLVLKKPFDNIEVAQLASALTTKWQMTRQAEQKVSRLEAAVQERTNALEVANRELEALVHEVTQLATHDTLTGLPNRLLFADRAAQALAVGRRDGSCPAVLMIDLDRFKEVNDTLGHQRGDMLLQQVAQRLSAAVRPGDTAARFGGDEFALLLANGGIEASIGIAAATAGEQQPTLEELLRQADIAMYKAKADQSGFAHYAACNDDGTPDRLTLIGELRQALDCEELLLYYQPKVAIDTGELIGVEALIRWQHPTRGLLPPAAFIALAEESTLIKRLTTYVLDRALRFCRDWLDQQIRIPIAVNVSARSLCDPAFPDIVADRLIYADVPAELLTIELTEGTVMAYPGLGLGILQKLRSLGVHLSVDDYGTGYSSLAYLKKLPATELKIDREFVNGVTRNFNDATIVQSATDLGHNLGLTVVAEGVEDQATLTALKALGVDVAQGFHLGRPMPENLLKQWIADRTDTTTPQITRPTDQPTEDPHHITT
jgi:predicted signal transduction protein with EAL and GGDEF domain